MSEEFNVTETTAPFVAQANAAVEAIAEIAPRHQIGGFLRAVAEDDPNVVTLRFASDVPGYPHWEWGAELGRADAEATPTVLEVGLYPGEGALVSPAWVPWSERFAEYQAQHQADEEAEADSSAEAEVEAADSDTVSEDAISEDAISEDAISEDAISEDAISEDATSADAASTAANESDRPATADAE